MPYPFPTHSGIARFVVCGLALGVSLMAARCEPYTFGTYIGSATNAGSADGTNGTAQFISPTGLARDSLGTLYVTDGNAVRSIALLGTNRVVHTLAGTIGSHAFADGTNGAAQFNYPQGVAVDAGGSLYVADTYNNAIRKVTAVGTNWVVTTIAGPAPPANPFGTQDGTNNVARFHNPYGIAVDSLTNVFVADSLNQTIRKITLVGTNWVVTTVAGRAGSAGSDNGSNDVARFSSPASVAVASLGTLYVVDLANNNVRKLSQIGTNWAVSTFAGFAGVTGSTDASGTNASFNMPQCVGVDTAGNVYVTDSGNHTVRKINPGGSVTTIGGAVGIPGAADGTGTAASFNLPYGIVADPSGVLYVADYLGYAIRQGQLALLRYSISAKTLVLSWPSSLTGFLPETTSHLGGVWNPVPGSQIVLSGQTFYVTNSVGSGAGLYRLHHPAP